MKLEVMDTLVSLFRHYVTTGNYESAKNIAEDLLKNKQLNIEFLLIYLEMAVMINDYDNALKCIDLLVSAGYSPSACELCLQLVKFRLKKINTVDEALNCAKILLSAGKLVEAEQVYVYASELAPDNLFVKYNWAKFYLDVGELPLAARMADEIIKIDNLNSKAWSVYGNALRMLGFELEAYNAHQKAISLDPESYESLLDLTATEVSRAKSDQDFEKSIKSSNQCLYVYLKYHYKFENLNASVCKIKHDNSQAKYLIANGCVENIHSFISFTDHVLDQLKNADSGYELKISDSELKLIHEYGRSFFISNQYLDVGPCVNSRLDWKLIANQYKNSSPSLVVIDDFLSPEALDYLRKFCYESKVWHKTYQHAYLGAFVDKGFVSKVHLKISEELKIHLSDVIQNDRLEQLWAFKYDSILGKGINIHADFARINLNFWITPDEYHLNKQNGGLIVYSEPAPRDWDYFDYNINSEKIYEYLGRHNSKSVTVPYKANRAVLFDSTLFHETDEIKFEDSYLGRRVNMTYLFGTQLT